MFFSGEKEEKILSSTVTSLLFSPSSCHCSDFVSVEHKLVNIIQIRFFFASLSLSRHKLNRLCGAGDRYTYSTWAMHVSARAHVVRCQQTTASASPLCTKHRHRHTHVRSELSNVDAIALQHSEWKSEVNANCTCTFDASHSICINFQMIWHSENVYNCTVELSCVDVELWIAIFPFFLFLRRQFSTEFWRGISIDILCCDHRQCQCHELPSQLASPYTTNHVEKCQFTQLFMGKLKPLVARGVVDGKLLLWIATCYARAFNRVKYDIETIQCNSSDSSDSSLIFAIFKLKWYLRSTPSSHSRMPCWGMSTVAETEHTFQTNLWELSKSFIHSLQFSSVVVYIALCYGMISFPQFTCRTFVDIGWVSAMDTKSKRFHMPSCARLSCVVFYVCASYQ